MEQSAVVRYQLRFRLDVIYLAFSYYLHQKFFNLASVARRRFFNCPTIGNTCSLCVSVKRQPTRKWHIWFLPTHEPTLKKPKEPFFATARQKVDNFWLTI
ncbi:MAG: hypothetical protein KGZ37_00020 [Nitrosarchaeum sp.]|nr:hypothetical protein [Nitrosarchaeum sp.]